MALKTARFVGSHCMGAAVQDSITRHALCAHAQYSGICPVLLPAYSPSCGAAVCAGRLSVYLSSLLQMQCSPHLCHTTVCSSLAQDGPARAATSFVPTHHIPGNQVRVGTASHPYITIPAARLACCPSRPRRHAKRGADAAAPNLQVARRAARRPASTAKMACCSRCAGRG